MMAEVNPPTPTNPSEASTPKTFLKMPDPCEEGIISPTVLTIIRMQSFLLSTSYR